MFDDLKLGDEITEAACTAILGFTRDQRPEDFALGLLRIKHDVEKALKARHGREITVRIVKDTVRVLDDREAAEYNPKRFADGLRIARRAHRRLMAVDVSKLTPTEREEYGKAVTKQAAKLSMIRKPQPEAEPVPAETTLPRMFAKKQ